MLATDPITRRNLGGYLGRGENEHEIAEFLLHLRDENSIYPEFMIVDYKPSWELVINRVFPQALIIRCSFHTVQLINRAIVNELNYISKKKFALIIKQTKKLYQQIKKDQWNGSKIISNITNKTIKEFEGYYYLLSDLLKIKVLGAFKKSLNQFINYLKIKHSIYSKQLSEELVKRLPKRGLTPKGLKYYKVKARAALNLVMREFRRELEGEKRQFTHIKYLLLKRPEKLTNNESQKLKDFLNKNPEFNKYRVLSMRISNLYHMNPKKIVSSRITNIKLWSNAHPKLQAAVKTLKKNVDKILNFIELFSRKKFKKNKKIPRTTPEHEMRKIKDLNRMKFGFRNVEKTRLLMQNRLNCRMMVTRI